MCLSCPPTDRNLCFLCGVNHLVSDRQPSPLATMPGDLMIHSLSFDPTSVLMLRMVSSRFKHVADTFLQLNTAAIVPMCTRTRSALYDRISNHFVRCNIRFGTQTDRIGIRFHLSISRSLRAFGIRSEGILTPHEIAYCNHRIETSNLRRCWGPLRAAILVVNPLLEGVPGVDAASKEMRQWMRNGANSEVLQAITALDLSGLQLTCVPKEIALCTGLQGLDLSSNRLLYLPEDFLRGMSGLQGLNLSNNRLTTLPEMLFHGLTRLQTLNFNLNSLVTLPEGLLQGLTGLRRLEMESNRLITLPEGFLRGLTGLEELYLMRNAIGFLPVGFLDGLTALTRFYLSGNQLVSLPGGFFHETVGLIQLDLCANRLTFLPRGLFDGLEQLEWLALYSNPDLLLSLAELPFPRNDIAFVATMQGFFNYRCKSPCAELYQLVAGGGSREAVREVFSQVPETMQQGILSIVREEAHLSQGHEQDPFNDMQIFARCLKRYVQNGFESLTREEKRALHQKVDDLALGERRGGAQSGERHMSENILRLIDAVIQLQEEQQRSGASA